MVPSEGLPGDRLAVWTYDDSCGEVACGHPGVTDEERSAAGRPTLAELERAVGDRNRRRAAELGRSPGPLPDDVHSARVWWSREPAFLRARLGGDDLAVWAEGDVLHVVWRGTAEKVEMFSGVNATLWPVPGTDDLWEASLRIRKLEHFAVSLFVAPQHAEDGGPSGVRHDRSTVWRGPAASPTAPEARPLRGRLVTHRLESTALPAPRAVTVYLPPDDLAPGGLVRGCVLADGQAVEHYAPVLEHAMRSGVLAPTVVVGVHAVIDATPTWPDTRTQEYVPGENRRRFAAHLRFVVDEVLPWVRDELGVDVARWIAAGFSNGAVWAIAAAQRRPEVFPQVVALSPGVPPRRVSGRAQAAGVRHYLAAGLLEPGFLRAARGWAQRLRRTGLDVRLVEVHGGHDDLWWREHLVTGLAHLEKTSARSS